MIYEFHEREGPCIAVLNSRVAKRFEWFHTLQDMKMSALHVIDEAFLWYHGCADEVRPLLDKHKPSLIVGVSMGGYAALLLGALHGIKARAFGPQTTLIAGWDKRWTPEWETIKATTKHPEWLDLLNLDIKGDIYYCLGSQQDVQHARRLKRKVKLIPRGCTRHEDSAVDLPTSEIFSLE